MGAWGHGTFQNDTACDWAYDLEAHSDLGFVEASLNAVLSSDQGYLDADLGCCGLAACEVLAGLIGKPGSSSSYTETIEAWIAAYRGPKPGSALMSLAQRAITCILSDGSELHQLWKETSNGAWKEDVLALKARLA